MAENPAAITTGPGGNPGVKPPFPKHNMLLAAFPAAVRKRLAGSLRRAAFRRGETIHEPGETIRNAYFPLTAVVSVVTRMMNGEAVESATVGNEGLVGLPAFLVSCATIEAFVQVPGDCLEISRADLLAVLRKEPKVEALLAGYTAFFMRFLSQSSACNRVHHISERCARWLLMAHNRSEGDTFSLTQEFLGEMMGVRRATVTEVMLAMRRRHLVDYSRGRIRILDREGLEDASCECYETLHVGLEELLHPGRT